VTRIRLAYVHAFRDRHGKVRHYFRRPGFKQIALPGLPGSDQFMEAYRAALAGQAPRTEIGASRTKPGTINAVVVSYFSSVEFLSLATSTRKTYQLIIERFRTEHGDKSVADMQREHIVAMLGKRAETPVAANNWLRMVRMLMQFAVDQKMRSDNPAVAVKSIRVRSQGFEMWQPEHVDLYRQHFSLGTRSRLALELLYGTMQRRGDVVRMGRQHIRNEVLSIRQEKTGAQIDIPVFPELRKALDASRKPNISRFS
jgi:integrase